MKIARRDSFSPRERFSAMTARRASYVIVTIPRRGILLHKRPYAAPSWLAPRRRTPQRQVAPRPHCAPLFPGLLLSPDARFGNAARGAADPPERHQHVE